ncbi:hypothetical protein HRH25_12480 [Flavisolibacter sp. BT320]|nr:hypothetical protein [Flavisolibacter longurius]
MKRLQTMLLAFVVLGSTTMNAQKIKLTEGRLQAVDVSMSLEKIKGKKALRVVKDSTVKSGRPAWAFFFGGAFVCFIFSGLKQKHLARPSKTFTLLYGL